MSTELSVGIIIALLILAIARQIDWKKWAIKWVGNDPKKGQVYIRAGRDRHTVEGVRGYVSPLAQVYRYTDGKEKNIVIVPGPVPGPEYPYEYIRGRRFIEVDDGQLVATALSSLSDAEKKKYAESVTDISALTEGSSVVAALKTVKRQGQPKWLTWVIVAVVVAAAYLYYSNYMQDSGPGQEPNIPAQSGVIPPEKLQEGVR